MRDDDVGRMFSGLTFEHEPPMRSRAIDDVQRGRRHVRRRRTAAFGATAGGSAAVAAAVVMLLPGGATNAGPGMDVADAGRDQVENVTVDEDAVPFAATYQTMIDVAGAHFDPDGEHLKTRPPVPVDMYGATSWQVSSKLEWTNPGETGMGMVQVIVTLPGHAAQKGAFGDVATMIGCDFDGSEIIGCAHRNTSSGERVLVAEPAPDRNLLFGAMYEREDGSFAAVAVHDLFGNNSLEPVSSVDVTLDQAVAFVTDLDLRVDADEAAAELARVPDEPVEPTEPDEPADYTNRKVVVAPASEEMTADALRAEFESCVSGVPAWSDFEPMFGLWIDQRSANEQASWLMAERGDTTMLCLSGDVALFGSEDTKGVVDNGADLDTIYTDHFGVYSEDVSTVTVQLDGQPEQEAVMHDGYWYLPIPMDQERRIALRAYGSDDELVHDSTSDPDAMAESDR